MLLNIQMTTSKDNMSFITGTSAKEMSRYLEKDYFFQADFDVFASKTELETGEEVDEISDEDKVRVGEIVASFIDEANCLNDGVDALVIADDESIDFGIALDAMQRSRDYEKLSINKEWQPLFTVYMDTFYIYPEYRNKGIGTYLLNNIGDILRIFTNKEIHAVGVILKPQCLSGETMTEEEESAMLRKMQRLFKNAGYKKIKNSEVYMNNYGATDSYIPR